ncbi:major facilitator family transporter, putative [marine gamma proteobacterium HTCC2080]|jgi:MFS family permease|nr:major facilitator family transporter, putative [marine gamma proteobacterium HTCC2080]
MSNTHLLDHSLSQTTLISAIYPVGPAAIIVMPMIVGGLIDSYGFSEQQAGAVASAEGVGLVLGLLMAALWVRTVRWRSSLFVGLAGYALLNFGSSMAEGHTQIMALRFLSGYIGGCVFAIVVAALGDNREPDRAFGIGQAVQGLLMGLLFMLAPLLMSIFGVNGVFYMMAALALLAIPFLPRFPQSGVIQTAVTDSNGGGKTPVKVIALLYLSLLGGFVYYLAVFGFWGFIERIGMQAGLEQDAIGLALGVSQLAAIMGALIAAGAAQRFGRFMPLLVALLGQLCVLWLLVGQFSSLAFYAGACAYQGLYVMATSYQLGVVATLDNKGKFIVIMTALQGLGAALGPSIAASLVSDGDYSAVNWAAAGALVFSLGLFLMLAGLKAARPSATGE